MIRDRLVCEVNDERIQRRLLAQSRLDFKKALELATAMDIADKNMRHIQQGNSVEKLKESPVNRLNKEQGKKTAKECYRRGRFFMKLKNAGTWMKSRKKKKGRKASKCRVKLKTNQRNGKKQGNTHDMEATDSEEKLEEEDTAEYTKFHVAAKEREPYRVEINLNGISTTMEVDTEAAATIISEETFKKISRGNSAQNKLEMKPTQVKLRTYTGESVKILGTVEVVVFYEGQEKELSTLIGEGSGPTLLGRDWLKDVKLDWRKLFKMEAYGNQAEPRLKSLITQ